MDNCQQQQALEISIQTPIFGDNNVDDHVGEEGSPISLTSESSPKSEILSSSCSSSKKKHHRKEIPMYRLQQLKRNQK